MYCYNRLTSLSSSVMKNADPHDALRLRRYGPSGEIGWIISEDRLLYYSFDLTGGIVLMLSEIERRRSEEFTFGLLHCL